MAATGLAIGYQQSLFARPRRCGMSSHIATARARNRASKVNSGVDERPERSLDYAGCLGSKVDNDNTECSSGVQSNGHAIEFGSPIRRQEPRALTHFGRRSILTHQPEKGTWGPFDPKRLC
jgi:hypothetical protein